MNKSDVRQALNDKAIACWQEHYAEFADGSSGNPDHYRREIMRTLYREEGIRDAARALGVELLHTARLQKRAVKRMNAERVIQGKEPQYPII